MENILKRMLLSDWSFKLLYVALGISIGFIISAFYIVEHISLMEALKIILTPSIVFVSVFLASRSYIYTRDWNKKNSANQALYRSKEKINEHIDYLSPFFNMRQMMRNGEVASIQNIHNAMGVFISEKNSIGKNVYRFVYHSKEPCQQDIQNIHNSKQSNYCVEFDKTVNGKQIERAILSLLGEYEYLCMSAMTGIFDKEAIIELIAPNIVTTFNTLSDYIMHLRIDKRHGGGRAYVYEYFEKFSKEIILYKDNKFNLKIVELEEKKERHHVPFLLSL